MSRIYIATIVCVILSDVRASSNLEWTAWKEKHGKSYKSAAEETLRFEHFEIMKAVVEKHNAEAAAGKHTYTLGLNHMSDMTLEERRAFLQPLPSEAYQRVSADGGKRQTRPTTYSDWTTTGLVPPVRQQICNNCWAFAGTDALAYYYAKATGLTTPLQLSPQEVTDCALGWFSKLQGGTATPNGCTAGSYAHMVYMYAAANKIDPDSAYPMNLQSGTGACNQNAAQAVQTVADPSVAQTGSYITLADETALANYVGTSGPATIGLWADCDQFAQYKAGILSNVCGTCTLGGKPVPAKCSNSINHNVLVVGYGMDTASNTPYYKAKNSWDTTWGESGFFRVQAFTGEMNLDTSTMSYPLICLNKPCYSSCDQISGTLGQCITGCNTNGACCQSSSDCFFKNCDTQPQSGICMMPCSMDPGCTQSAQYCNAYTPQPPYNGASCVNGMCQCNKQ